MAESLPDCSAITQVCTSCLFGASYTIVDPPFELNYTATSTPTVIADVTTFANGSVTTNIVEATQAIDSSPTPIFETWEVDNITFTYGSTYLNYTAFDYATPPPPTSYAQNTLACYSGNPADDTSLSQLNLPSSIAPGSLILTLADNQPLPFESIPAEILTYLDGLPTVSEQLNGNPLSICSPTTPPTPSCTSHIPSNCPPPTATTTITVTHDLDGTSPTVIRNGTLAQRGVARQTKRQAEYYSATSALLTFSWNGTYNGSVTSFPPGCPQTATETISLEPPLQSSSAASTATLPLDVTTKETRNALNIGPATTIVRSFTSLAADSASPPDAAGGLADGDGQGNEPQPVQPVNGGTQGNGQEAAQPVQQPEGSPDNDPSPAAQPEPAPDNDPSPAGQPAPTPNDNSSPQAQPALSPDGSPNSAQPDSNPENDSNQDAQPAPPPNSNQSPSSGDLTPLPTPDAYRPSSNDGDPAVVIYTATLPKVTGYTTLVISDPAPNAGSDAADSPQFGAGVCTTVIPLTSGFTTLTLTQAIGTGHGQGGALNPTGSAGSPVTGTGTGAGVYTTVVPYGTGSTTIVVTPTAASGGTSTADDTSTVGVGGYVNGGLGSSESGSGSGSASTQSVNGLAGRVGVVDVRGLLRVGVGVLMGI